MRRIAIVNQKGGCGKTTTAINLAMSLACREKRVLLIDMDPQGHISTGLGVRPEDSERSIYEVLLKGIPITEAIQPLRSNLDGILSDVLLSGFEQVMAGVEGREYRLAESIEAVSDDYDFLILDSPPSVGLLTVNGLFAADELLIPIDSGIFSLDGLEKLMDTIQMIEQAKANRFVVMLLAVNVDRRTRFGRKLLAFLESYFPENFLSTIVDTCTAIRESSSLGKPIHEHNTSCSAFRNYQGLADEILLGKRAGMPAAFDVRDLALWEPGAVTVADLAAAGKPGNPSSDRLVEFVVEAPAEADVKIAGDFNGWSPKELIRLRTDGRQRWCKSLRLKPGVYRYKYVINGTWVPDARNECSVDDNFGGQNSVIQV